MASRRKKTRPDYSDEREAAGPADYDSDDSVADPNYMPQDDDVFLSDPAIPPVNTTTTSPASPAPSSSKSLRCSKFDHYFEISEDRSSAVCKICMSKKLKVALKMSHRSTSGLKKHLQRHHKEEFNKMFPDEELKIAPKQQTLLTSIFGKRKVSFFQNRKIIISHRTLSFRLNSLLFFKTKYDFSYERLEAQTWAAKRRATRRRFLNEKAIPGGKIRSCGG